MEGGEEGASLLGTIPNLTSWFPKLIDTQIDLLATTLASILTTLKPCHNNNNGTITTAQSQALHVAKRLGSGVLGAVYGALVLTLVLVVSIVVGVLLVNYLVDQPVCVREKLYFDYTDVNPHALFVFSRKTLPVGHTFYVSVLLLVPDSDYNRHIGVFQLMAEVVSKNGRVIARSSRPSMLEFHSLPIRLIRTFIKGLPILLGISRETQKIKAPMLRYKEDNILRTEAVRITLMPRAGVPYLPQVYEAEIIMHSKLPRVKELMHKWKWTLYVWTSLYVYIVLLLFLFCFFRTFLIFPLSRGSDRHKARVAVTIGAGEDTAVRGGREFSATLRKWQQYRRKRKAAFVSKSTVSENVGSTSASSYTMLKDDIDPAMEEVSDSGSVCKGG